MQNVIAIPRKNGREKFNVMRNQDISSGGDPQFVGVMMFIIA
jgi:hypothetical protein